MIDNWFDIVFCLSVLCMFLYTWLSNTKAEADVADSTRVKDSRDHMGIAAAE